MPRKPSKVRTGRQMTLTGLPRTVKREIKREIKRDVRREVKAVKRFSSRVYKRTKMRSPGVNIHNKKILELARAGVTEREICDKLSMKPRLTRIELKFLEKLGLLK